jgi:serine/threonine protein kinase
MNIRVIKELGRGTFGRVELIEDLNDGNKRKAMKTLLSYYENKYDSDLLTEMYILENINHPNILSSEKVKLNDGTEKFIYLEPLTNEMSIFSNAMDGNCGDFFFRGGLERASSVIVHQLVLQITKGLYELHSRGFVHNDLKLQNMLYKYQDEKYNFKIADFGLSKYLGIPHPKEATMFRCTPWHKAPNSIDDRYYHAGNRHNYNSDMYSLGSCMYWLCNKKYQLPMYSDEYKDEVIDNRSATFTSRIPYLKKLYGEYGFDFLMRCLEPDSKIRLNSKDALNHPYLSVSSRGGATKLFDYIDRTITEPKSNDYLDQVYEFKYLEDMYDKYRENTISIYVDLKRHPNLKYNMFLILNDWIYTVISNKKYNVANLETYVQYLLYLVHFLNNTRDIPRNQLQMYGLSCSYLTLETFFAYEMTASVGFGQLHYLTQRAYSRAQFIQSFDKILATFNYKLSFSPLILLVTYHYLHAIYEAPEVKPDFQIFKTSIANLIVILMDHQNPNYIDISADDLAKWCVLNAFVSKGYQRINYNSQNLVVPRDLFLSFNQSIDRFKKKPMNSEFTFYAELKNNVNLISPEVLEEQLKLPPKSTKAKKVAFLDKYQSVKISAKYI